MVERTNDRDDDVQNDETADSQTTMSYDFITNGDEESENNNGDQNGNDWNWGYSDHSTATDEERSDLSESIRRTMDALDSDVDEEMMAVLQDASDLVEDISVNKFECPHEECGLGHNHPDWKHDITASTDTSEIRSAIAGFNISDRFADQMEFQRNCHCGANEAAMLVQFFPYISIPMFSDQHEFEGVLELEPDVLDEVYRVYNEDDVSVSVAAGRVASSRGQSESEVVPLGLRDDLKAFCERRQQVEQQAQKAPIAQETRAVIEANRKELEEVTSQ